MTTAHVAFFLPNLKMGGAERSVVLLANAMAREGARVDVVLINAKGDLLDEIKPPVRVIDLASDRFARSIPKLAKYLREERPNGLYSQMFDTAVFAAAGIKLSGVPVKLISTLHSTLSVQAREAETASVRGMKRKLTRALSVSIHKRFVDKIVAVSQGVADDFAQFTGIARDRIEVVYNPIDIEGIRGKAAYPVNHPWLTPDRSEPVFVAVGNLKHAKGYDNLIRAFSGVTASAPSRLVIVGEGGERQMLTDLAVTLGVQDRVDLVGLKTNPYPYMAQCDVFVLSSRREGSPTVLVEALAVGAKIVATDCQSGPREILENGKFGILVPSEDIDALAIAMNQAVEMKGPF